MLKLDIKQRQTFNIAAISFWGAFGSYAFNAVMILYLTKPIMKYGLGFTQSNAYAFQGVSQGMGYATLMIGGYIADKYLGIRRSILLGSLLLAIAFFLVFLSGFFVIYNNHFFIAAYSLVPVCGSLMLGTTTGLISKIHSNDKLRAKGAMTIFYSTINTSALIATSLAPTLINYKYGPLSILAIIAVGKLIAVLNFACKYQLYDDVIDSLDKNAMTKKAKLILIGYILGIYSITVIAYCYPNAASYAVGSFCVICLLFFIFTTSLLKGDTRVKQLVGIILIVIAIGFFIIYNQLNSTLVLCAKTNSTLTMLGIHVYAASYQLVNPFVIIIGGNLISIIYKNIPTFNIPYQFALGMILAGIGLLISWFGFVEGRSGLINGNYLVLTYVLISISELFISAIGLSMIGLYCDLKNVAIAMGAWYTSCALSCVLSGQLNQFVAVPSNKDSVHLGAVLYQSYFLKMGISGLLFAVLSTVTVIIIIKYLKYRNIEIA